MNMNQYLDIFIEETRENLQNLNQSLLELEKNSDDVSILNEIFRVAHTLKGMSGTMGFSRMSNLTHTMESVLQALRNNTLKMEKSIVDLLFKCLDALEDYLESIVATSSEGSKDYSDLTDALARLIEKGTGGEETSGGSSGNSAYKTAYKTAQFELNQYEQNVVNRAAKMGYNIYRITVLLNKGCLLKSARAFVVFQTIERYSEIIKSVPKVEDIEDERFDFEFTVVVVTKESAEFLSRQINNIAEIDEVEISAVAATPDTGVAAGTAGEVADFSRKNVPGAGLFRKAEEEAAATKTTAARTRTGKTVRVDIDRLDLLMNLVSELIITKNRLEGMDEIQKSKEISSEINNLERITTNIHDAVMKVRMVPVETVFNRFPRMIRDISQELGKQIELVMTGIETELDRTVIDEIGEPLIHLLRNSADHGIEPAEARKAAGKPETGRISLSAYQSGNNVIIEVEDDGSGIDTEKIRRKVVEKGLCSEEDAKFLSQNDLVDYLFTPGFSTADKVTDISGRGVGLDVVKSKIESLSGSVSVETELGKGTRFIIRLPLTLAIYQALLVRVDCERYAIPLSNIERVIRIKPGEIQTVRKQQVILQNNVVIPIIRLDEVLGIRPKGDVPAQYTVVIARKGDKLSGLIVDGIVGQMEIVIKNLGKLLEGTKNIAGATILGDGSVVLILDINSLM